MFWVSARQQWNTNIVVNFCPSFLCAMKFDFFFWTIEIFTGSAVIVLCKASSPPRSVRELVAMVLLQVLMTNNPKDMICTGIDFIVQTSSFITRSSTNETKRMCITAVAWQPYSVLIFIAVAYTIEKLTHHCSWLDVGSVADSTDQSDAYFWNCFSCRGCVENKQASGLPMYPNWPIRWDLWKPLLVS